VYILIDFSGARDTMVPVCYFGDCTFSAVSICSAGFPPNKSADQPQAENLRYRLSSSAENVQTFVCYLIE
jgi:hypothetical protein